MEMEDVRRWFIELWKAWAMLLGEQPSKNGQLWLPAEGGWPVMKSQSISSSGPTQCRQEPGQSIGWLGDLFCAQVVQTRTHGQP